MTSLEKVALFKVKDYDRKILREKTEAIFDAFGGAAGMFKRGDRVLIKPNLLLARDRDRHVTTHPEIVFAAGSILKDLGCELTIGDSPGFGSAVSVADKCGVGAVARELGAKVVSFKTSAELKVNSENRIFKRFEIAGDILEADKVVNLAKLKSHGQMLLTMAVKNMFGAVVGLLKPQWHFKAGSDADLFARMLVELNLAIAPAFTILDGIYGMEGNGPSNGDARELNILMGGKNCVAIDAAAAAILKIQPKNYFTGRAAIKMGLPGAELSDIEIVGDMILDFNIENFKLPHLIDADWPIFQFMKKFLKSFFTPAPLYRKAACKFCMICKDLCPAKAITQPNPQDLDFDLKKCIRCFCCQEMCPHGAITVKTSSGQRIKDLFGFSRRKK